MKISFCKYLFGTVLFEILERIIYFVSYILFIIVFGLITIMEFFLFPLIYVRVGKNKAKEWLIQIISGYLVNIVYDYFVILVLPSFDKIEKKFEQNFFRY